MTMKPKTVAELDIRAALELARMLRDNRDDGSTFVGTLNSDRISAIERAIGCLKYRAEKARRRQD